MKTLSHISKGRGFTLVELLVVLGIIGLIGTIVLANLGNARKSARDGKRASDLKELQLALEQYFDKNNSFPNTGSAGLNGALSIYVAQPITDPSNSGKYIYGYAPIITNGTAYGFCLGVTFEGDKPSSLPPTDTCTTDISGNNYKFQGP